MEPSPAINETAFHLLAHLQKGLGGTRLDLLGLAPLFYWSCLSVQTPARTDKLLVSICHVSLGWHMRVFVAIVSGVANA